MEKSPWRRQWHNTGVTTHSSIIAWEIHGKKRLAGYSPWSCKESDTTEQLSAQTHTHYGEPVIMTFLSLHKNAR